MDKNYYAGDGPQISIIITCYNDGIYLSEALDSILALSSFIEIIIVNDGSTDIETLDVLRKLQDKVIVLHQPNQGVAVARNNGVKHSRSKYYLPLDADNKLSLDYISAGVKFLETHPEYAAFYSDYFLFGEADGYVRNKAIELHHFAYENYVDTCAVIRKSAWNSINGYDENAPINTWQDWIFWIDILLSGWKLKHEDRALFYYRVRRNSAVRTLTQSNERKLVMFRYIYPRQILLLKKAKSDYVDQQDINLFYWEDKINIRLAYFEALSGNILRSWNLLFSLFIPNHIFIKLRIMLGTPIKGLLVRKGLMRFQN